MVSRSEKVKHIINNTGSLEHHYVPNYSELAVVVKTIKNAGYKVVLTQGVYDLFHVGHKRYLEEAKNYGDILIVGVDTDELTKKRKGPSRPFDTLTDRVEILSGLKAVDIITIRRESDHFYKLIQLVCPDILVMSETTEDFTEKDKKNLLQYCGEIKVLPAKAGTSTTAKLRRMMVDGIGELGQKIQNIVNDFLKGSDQKKK